jgi:hypothetical protein
MSKTEKKYIPDLIFKMRLGKMETPKGVDREDFIKYLEDLHFWEEKAENWRSRVFTKLQAELIVLFTGIMALCAVTMLLIEGIRVLS